MIWENLLRQHEKYRQEHIYLPRYLCIEPEMCQQLFKELDQMLIPRPSPVNGKTIIMGMEIVVLPIPELFYVAGYPDSEIWKYLVHKKGIEDARRSE